MPEHVYKPATATEAALIKVDGYEMRLPDSIAELVHNIISDRESLRAKIGELEGLVADAIKFMDSEEACQGGFCDECEASIGECLVVRLKDALNKEAFTAAGEEGERDA